MLGTKLRDTGEVEHAHAVSGAGPDLRVVGIDSLLADEDNRSVIFLPNLANCHRQPLADAPPCDGVGDAIDEQHGTAEAILLA